jgi:glutamate-1-semialdehyde 2,1-aminomutase
MADAAVPSRHEGLSDTARRVLPGGTFGGVGLDVVIQSGHGGRITDVNGRSYIDFLLGSGPMLIGHSHPQVNAAVMEQVARGTTFYTNNEPGIRLAEAIVDAVPCADQVRFTSSGSEATFFALRAARAFRRRDKILKFEGGYHGGSDYAMMSTTPQRPGNFPQAAPDTAGIPDALRHEVLIAPFNDIETTVSLIEAHRDELAGVIMEPFQRILVPKPGFLEAVRDVTRKFEIPLIFDEIVTGFRLAYGGAQEYYGVTPDLCALGKIIGGGFPLAAVAGRADIMAHFDKSRVEADRFTPQSGTLNGNPVAATAGLATLDVLRQDGTYAALFATGARLKSGLERLLRDAGLTAVVIGVPPLFDVVFTEGPIQDYRGMLRGNAGTLKRFNQLCFEEGVIKGDSKIYVSCAHTAADIDEALAVFGRVVARMANDPKH